MPDGAQCANFTLICLLNGGGGREGKAKDRGDADNKRTPGAKGERYIAVESKLLITLSYGCLFVCFFVIHLIHQIKDKSQPKGKKRTLPAGSWYIFSRLKKKSL